MEQRQLDLLKAALEALCPDKDFPTIDAAGHPFSGLRLVHIMRATRNSSWDFPSFVMAIIPHNPELDQADQVDPDEMPMHPLSVPQLVKIFQDVDPEIEEEDFEFDT